MLAQVYVKRGCLVPMHSHESEQMTLRPAGRAEVSRSAARRSPCARARCCTSRRGSNTRPKRSRTRSSSTVQPDSAGLARSHRRLFPTIGNRCSDSRSAGRRRARRVGDRKLQPAGRHAQSGAERMAQIDVQLKRRADLIPNLVNTVRASWSSSGHAETVMNARARALTATGPPTRRRTKGSCRRRSAACSRCGELPRAQVERQRPDAGGAVGDREQGRLRAAVLQRHRDEVQHGAAGVPDEPLRRHARLQAGGALRDHHEADREVPMVDLSRRRRPLAL